MRITRRIGSLAFDGMQALDLVGPADAFGSDALMSSSPVNDEPQPYEVVAVGLTGKRIISSSGVLLHAHVGAYTNIQFDTIMVPGGVGLRKHKLYLAFVEEELGPQAALSVAREMVVCMKGPGGQNQFSEPLTFQFQSANRFKDVAAWIHTHLRADLSIEALAARVHRRLTALT
jgi:transcriptional regulator GlxA family with amidase domain